MTTTLIRHTVASRLFAPELMREHLAFCAKLAEQEVERLRALMEQRDRRGSPG